MKHCSLTVALVPTSIALALALGLCPAACVGTTGGERVAFVATVAGVEAPWPTNTFTNDYGWQVTLSRADMTVGPIYLNTQRPLAPAGALWRALRPIGVAHAGVSHLEEGRVVGEVLGQARFDALSPVPVAFPVAGTASEEIVRSLDVWLSPPASVPIETKKISHATVELEGVARREGVELKFRGKLVLDDTWLPDVAPGDRGAQSVASLRQIRGIGASFVPSEGGTLDLRVDPSRLLRGADFANIAQGPSDLADPSYRLLVQSKTGKFTTDQVMRSLFNALRSSTGTYAATWRSR